MSNLGCSSTSLLQSVDHTHLPHLRHIELPGAASASRRSNGLKWGSHTCYCVTSLPLWDLEINPKWATAGQDSVITPITWSSCLWPFSVSYCGPRLTFIDVVLRGAKAGSTEIHTAWQQGKGAALDCVSVSLIPFSNSQAYDHVQPSIYRQYPESCPPIVPQGMWNMQHLPPTEATCLNCLPLTHSCFPKISFGATPQTCTKCGFVQTSLTAKIVFGIRHGGSRM